MIEQFGMVAVLALCSIVLLRLMMYVAFRVFGLRDQTGNKESDQ